MSNALRVYRIDTNNQMKTDITVITGRMVISNHKNISVNKYSKAVERILN